jgi:hypothetical protein
MTQFWRNGESALHLKEQKLLRLFLTNAANMPHGKYTMGAAHHVPLAVCVFIFLLIQLPV